MSAQAVEAEAIIVGDRAAEAIILENDGLHNKSAITARAEEAEQASDTAA